MPRLDAKLRILEVDRYIKSAICVVRKEVHGKELKALEKRQAFKLSDAVLYRRQQPPLPLFYSMRSFALVAD